MSKDKLDIMFDIQNKAQINLGTWNKIKNESDKQKFVNQMILACQEEIIEIMRETSYKNPNFVEFGWKKNQSWNLKNYKEEIIDLWHFVMNLCLVVGMSSEEFFEIYKKKNKENLERWNNDY